ncbi:integral membrane protein [Dehalogenimonas formicexedens]|uniref:Integral membrane protein n=1 Tax=Dehalogenimonas formicexedens TaxID=1839801 RepID=A0A1P8FAH8_9CHLR|nr:TIGR01906 family membrane protein [Dehalogenimonas formicexedens]APV45463.1 integral membrane protein [Dehalogenimonas formicexedens]
MKIIRWAVTVIIPLLIVSGVVAFAFNFLPLYEYGFHRYDVTQTTGLSDSELTKAARGLVSYFNSDEEFINITVQKNGSPFRLFNEREILHLKDVKSLVTLDYNIFIVTMLCGAAVTGFIVFRKRPRLLTAPAFWGGAITLAGLILVTAVAASNFDAFFTRFHQLSFANDFWLLDPSKDYLIMLFPAGFWQDASIFIAGLIGLIAAGLTLFTWRNLKING